MTIETQTESMVNSVKDAFAPVTDAFKNLQTMQVPEAARDFLKRTADTAKTKAADFHAGTEKVTAAVESAAATSLSETAKISRNVQSAFFQDVEAFFVGVDKLASATSLNEAVQIQTNLLRSHGEVLVARAKASTEYLGKLVADSTKSAQANFSKVAGQNA